MNDKYIHFLLDMGAAHEKMRRFNEDPEGVMDQYGLSDEQKAAIMSRNPDEIRKHVPKGHADYNTVEVNILMS